MGVSSSKTEVLDCFAMPAIADKPVSYYSPLRDDIAQLLPESIVRCLEIGCGTGSTLAWIKSVYGSETIGVDISEMAAERAKGSVDRMIVGNVENLRLPIPAKSLDVVLCLDVLEHLVDPWSVVQRMSRLLKPSGCLIASIPNVQHATVILDLLRGKWNYTTEGLMDSTHLRFFTYSTARELFERFGLRVEIHQRFGGSSGKLNLLTFGLFRNFLATHSYVKASKPSSQM